MKRNRIIILLGCLVIVSPFLGLPYSFLHVVLPILGMLIAFIAFTLESKKSLPPVAHESSDL